MSNTKCASCHVVRRDDEDNAGVQQHTVFGLFPIHSFAPILDVDPDELVEGVTKADEKMVLCDGCHLRAEEERGRLE